MTHSPSHEWEVAEGAWGLSEPRPAPWSSGPWSLERRGDELADICYDGSVVLRMVRAVARDGDWNTVPAAVAGMREQDGRLDLDLHLHGLGAQIDATLSVIAGETLRFEFDAVSRAAFQRNRLGLVVLHPPAVAGDPLIVLHPDGAHGILAISPSESRPTSPHSTSPASNWRHDGFTARLGFEGDIFEMEDQRNWTDASFKTYSTPLSRPFPVLLPTGAHVAQAIELRVRRDDPAATSPAGPVHLTPHGAVPELLIGAATAPEAGPAVATPASGILVELDARAPNFRLALARAGASGLPLDVRIVADSAAQLDEVLAALDPALVARLGVFSPTSHVTEPMLWRHLTAAAARLGLDVPLIAGTRAHFTELNRYQQRLPADAGGVTFSVTPQMHAQERSQLVESIAMQAVVARDASRIAAGRPVHIGPVTLRSRFNAVATTAAPAERGDLRDGYGPGLLEDATDDRQLSSALAAWTVASFAALSSSGAASIAYFEEWGPRGLMDATGAPFPVLGAIELLHSLRGSTLLLASTVGTDIHLLGARGPGGIVIIGANLSPREKTVEVTWPLDGENGHAQLTIPAFGVSRLDIPA